MNNRLARKILWGEECQFSVKTGIVPAAATGYGTAIGSDVCRTPRFGTRCG
jgi:hypothetical protein